jgi:hypothetical protein
VAQLYSQALDSLFVVSYDSQSYGGGIPTHLHTDSDLFKYIKKSACTSENTLSLPYETVAAFCETHTKYTNTLCGQNAGIYLS